MVIDMDVNSILVNKSSLPSSLVIKPDTYVTTGKSNKISLIKREMVLD